MKIMITVLFARKDSIYKTIPGIDVWDEERDARNYVGNETIIAHPPCATWGKFAWAAKQNTHDLGYLAIKWVENNGGVIEHPYGSSLFDHVTPGKGFILGIDQSWFGHQARKKTKLYIVGINSREIPPYPLNFDRIEGKIEYMSKKDREKTPKNLALWLIELCLYINKIKYGK